jgi:hypothetical protein
LRFHGVDWVPVSDNGAFVSYIYIHQHQLLPLVRREKMENGAHEKECDRKGEMEEV